MMNIGTRNGLLSGGGGNMVDDMKLLSDGNYKHESNDVVKNKTSPTTTTTMQGGESLLKRQSHYLTLLLFLNLIVTVYYISGAGNSLLPECTSKSAAISTSNNPNQVGWVRPDVVYGLVHVAKTAGTEINRELTFHYERVCGNKGYSYDALATQERFQNRERGDVIERIYGDRSRYRVPFEVSLERGFDDCDFISLEQGPLRWSYIYSKWKTEMHVPCRSPFDHLLSECNWLVHAKGKNVTFDCEAEDLAAEIEKCTVGMARVDRQYIGHPNVTLKCFNPIPPQPYVDYMGKILQPKRVQADYIPHSSNYPRDKEHECIWKKDKEWQDKLLAIMQEKYFYYEYCRDCMGSGDEINL